MKNQNSLCKNLAPFEKGIGGATGSLIKRQPVVCGGWGADDGKARDECWSLDKSTSPRWMEFPINRKMFGFFGSTVVGLVRNRPEIQATIFMLYKIGKEGSRF